MGRCCEWSSLRAPCFSLRALPFLRFGEAAPFECKVRLMRAGSGQSAWACLLVSPRWAPPGRALAPLNFK